MATVTLDAAAPGKGAVRPVQVQGAAVLKLVTGKFSFDNSYPTGGEDISEITGLFREFLGIMMENPASSIGTGRRVVIDYTNKKAMLFTQAAYPAQITLATSAAADDIIDTAAAHGLVLGQKVRFASLTGGTGLTVGTTYYVIAANLAATTFQVSTTSGGAAVNFTADITAGEVIAEPPEAADTSDQSGAANLRFFAWGIA